MLSQNAWVGKQWLGSIAGHRGINLVTQLLQILTQAIVNVKEEKRKCRKRGAPKAHLTLVMMLAKVKGIILL